MRRTSSSGCYEGSTGASPIRRRRCSVYSASAGFDAPSPITVPSGRSPGWNASRRGSAAIPSDQLSAIAQTHELFTRGGIDYWLFGGWAVDFHAGSITRSHDDIDIAVWLDDHDRIAQLLSAEGWKHAPEADEDGGTGYERDAVRLELTFLVPGEGGEVYIPLGAGRVLWSDEPMSTDVLELADVHARVLGLAALKRGKSQPRDDPVEAAKDRADFATLSRLA